MSHPDSASRGRETISVVAGAGGVTAVTSLTLLQRARAGDGSAWQRLVRLYTPLVRYWCRRQAVTGADADDVAQEVFQAAAAGLNQFRRQTAGDTFRGWLRGIGRNKLADHWRRRAGQPQAHGGTTFYQQLQHAPAPPPVADTVGAAEDDDAAAYGELFRGALELVRGEFADRTWRAFWRTTIDEQKPAEVAVELGLSPAAVRMAKSRVLRRVREELGDVIE